MFPKDKNRLTYIFEELGLIKEKSKHVIPHSTRSVTEFHESLE